MPLLFVLHGGGGNARNMMRLTQFGFNHLADNEGFIVVYPQGVNKHWNDGRVDLGRHSDADDIGFFSALIDRLSSDYNIDAKRIYSTGISNGAMMSYRLACDLGDRFAGVAPVAGVLSQELATACTPSSPTNMLIIMGTDDPQMPYKGGEVDVLGVKRGQVLSAMDTLDFWKNAYGCSDTPVTNNLPDQARFDGTSISEIRYKSCDGVITLALMTIQGGGHTWPGGWQYLPRMLVGKTSRDIDANQVIWDFFKATSQSK